MSRGAQETSRQSRSIIGMISAACLRPWGNCSSRKSRSPSAKATEPILPEVSRARILGIGFGEDTERRIPTVALESRVQRAGELLRGRVAPYHDGFPGALMATLIQVGLLYKQIQCGRSAHLDFDH